MFMLCDTDINRQEDFGYKGSKGRGWPFTDKTTDLSASVTLISILIQE